MNPTVDVPVSVLQVATGQSLLTGWPLPAGAAVLTVFVILWAWRRRPRTRTRRPADWFTLGRADRIVDELIRTGTMAASVVVAPDVNGGGVRDSECLDAVGGPQVERWLYSVLVPFVDTHWATRPERAARVLGGMSAGGFCALDQGLRYPQVWGAIITLEGYGDPGRDTARALGLDAAALRSRSPSAYIPSLDPARAVPVFVGAAELSDPAAASAVADALRARQYEVVYRVEPGLGHTWAAARAGIPYGLTYTTQALGW